MGGLYKEKCRQITGISAKTVLWTCLRNSEETRKAPSWLSANWDKNRKCRHLKRTEASGVARQISKDFLPGGQRRRSAPPPDGSGDELP